MPRKRGSPRKPAVKTKQASSPDKGSGAHHAKKHREGTNTQTDPPADDDDALLCSPPRLRPSREGKDPMLEKMVDWKELNDSDYDAGPGDPYDPDLDSSLSDGSSVYSFDLAEPKAPPSTRKAAPLPLSYDDDSSAGGGSSIGSNPSAQSEPKKPKKPKKNPNLPKSDGKNAVTLENLKKNPAFSGFYNKNTTAAYQLGDGQLDCLREMDTDLPIEPISPETYDLQFCLRGAQQEYLDLIALTRKTLDTPNLMEILDDLNAALEDVEAALRNVNRVITETNKLVGAVESARSLAIRAANSWKGKKGGSRGRYAKWMKYVLHADMILRLVDGEKKAAAAREEAAKVEAAARRKEELADAAKEALGIERSQAEIADAARGAAAGSVATVDMTGDDEEDNGAANAETGNVSVGEAANEAAPAPSAASRLRLPKAANEERKIRTNKTPAPSVDERKAKEAAAFIPYERFLFYCAGGAKKDKPVDAKKNGIKWHNGTIRCGCCGNVPISQARYVWRHATNETHLENLAKLLERGTPLNQSVIGNLNPMAKIATISSGLKTFAEGCYTLEGDACLILRALSVFERIEASIESGFDTSGLDAAVERAFPLISSVDTEMRNEAETAKTAADGATAAVTALKDCLKELDERKKAVTTSTSGRGRTVRRTDKTTDEDALECILEEIVDKRIELRDAKKIEKDLVASSTEAESAYNEWKEEFPHRTRESLIAHGKGILEPVAEYYAKLFVSEGGDCTDTRQMAEACQIFDPIFLSNIDDETAIVTELYYLARKLKHFHYDRHFTENFYKGLFEEMPRLVKEAKRDHDLDRIKPSQKYKTRLQRRIKRNKMLEKDIDWRNDPGEYAERIWAWWKPRRKDYPVHALALRLVVLAQLSSCSVERVFSKLEKIRQVCGDKLYGDMMEVRLLLQCNGDLKPLLESLRKYMVE